MLYWDWVSFFKYLVSPFMLEGAWTTLWLSVVCMVIGIVLGFASALMMMSSNRTLRAIAGFYVWLWRGTPLLVQLVIIYTGLPQLGIKLGVIESVLLGLGLNEGAYFSEIIRAGIMAVDKGQFDAGRALSMDYRVLLRVVVLPQAARIIVPPLGNQFNGLLKTSSLASVVSMEELLRHAQELAQIEFRVLEVYVVAAIYYLVMTTIWGRIQMRIEAHFGRAYLPSAAGGSDVTVLAEREIAKAQLKQDSR